MDRLAPWGLNHAETYNVPSPPYLLDNPACFVGDVWLFLGSQSEGLVSRLDCSDGLAKPLDIKVRFESCSLARYVVDDDDENIIVIIVVTSSP